MTAVNDAASPRKAVPPAKEVRHDASATDSGGAPWSGRELSSTGFDDDLGAADPDLLAALDGPQDETALMRAVAHARLLVPIVAVPGEVDDSGEPMAEKSTDMAVVILTAAGGQRAFPVFSSLATLSAWDPTARPSPVTSSRAAQGAVTERCDVMLLDCGSARELVTGDGRAVGSQAESVARLLKTGNARWPPAAVKITTAMSVDFSAIGSPESSTSPGTATMGTSSRACATARINAVSSCGPSRAARRSGSAAPRSSSNPVLDSSRPDQGAPPESVTDASWRTSFAGGTALRGDAASFTAVIRDDHRARLTDPCFGLHLDEHLLIQESGHQDHGRRRTHLGEPLTMHPANGLTVGPVDHVYASLDDITQGATKGRDGFERMLHGHTHLPASVTCVSDGAVHDCRAAGDDDAVAGADRARVAEGVLPRTTTAVEPAQRRGSRHGRPATSRASGRVKAC